MVRKSDKDAEKNAKKEAITTTSGKTYAETDPNLASLLVG